MVTEKLRFGLEDITHYFENRAASEIYRELYHHTHSGKMKFMFCVTEAIGDYVLMALTQLTKSVDGALSKEIERNISSDEESLCLKNVGAPPYDALTERIRVVLGAVAHPYLEEHKLLGEYVRTLDVILMSIYGNVTQDAPSDIKPLLHQDKHQVDGDSFKKLIAWLEEQEEKDIPQQQCGKSIPDSLKPIFIPRLYQRIENLANFYNEGKAATLDESLVPDGENPQPEDLRDFLFRDLNRIFMREDEE
ncbi:hypothetical protein HYU21_01065 [Candidatus Woesearchaeota archaeon]|nr:hypothetical protein [Candidatus Woesearchaeota archaeon]